MNSYELSRKFWDYAFDNPEKIKPIHSAIYFFAIEHCNRLGWKQKFGLPSQMVMEAIGVKNWKTYSSGLNDLIEWGFINLIEKSVNQYSSNIIAIVNFTKAPTKALDKALLEHSTKQSLKHSQSIVSIDKQLNNEQVNNKTIKQSFETFWNLYDKKVDRKKSFDKWKRLKESERDQIIEKTPDYVKHHSEIKYRKNPVTFLNNRSWEDEIKTESQASEDNQFVYVNGVKKLRVY